jgi:hypothetical protein
MKDHGDFQPFYSVPAGEMMTSRSQFRAFEKKLEANDCYIRGGGGGGDTPSSREVVRNIEKHGEEWVMSDESLPKR